MALLRFKNIGVTALSACVPARVIDNMSYNLDILTEEEIGRIVEKTGVRQRRFADERTCASDLCFAAAERLFADNGICRDEIDLLVFLSQTPDYRMPATSILLQHRLGLSTSTMAFDISLGCSGFVDALAIVYSMMGGGNFKKALLLCGETRSKVYNRKDRQTAFLFGDAGSAALIERDVRFGESLFSIHNDGSMGDLIVIPGGGYRHMSSKETLEEKIVDEYGDIRSDENGMMNGADVFSFAIDQVPKDINALMAHSGETISSIDWFLLHQASGFINGHIERKLELPAEKTPHTIAEFGNTSSVSIPLTIAKCLKDKMAGRQKLLLSAFGVGMSWASAIVPFVDCKINDIVEV